MIKLTKKRELVYNIVKHSPLPLSAENISESLGDNQMNLSTVYRALEYLYTNKLVSKSIINNISFYNINHEKHAHYFVCEVCKKMTAFNCHLDHTISHVQDDHGFIVHHHDLTLYGICPSCQKG